MVACSAWVASDFADCTRLVSEVMPVLAAASVCWAWPIESPGVLATGSGPGVGGAELLYTWSNYELLDSLAVEAEGNVCVATLNRSAITVISPAGELVEVVDVAPGDDPICTNICFGGPDMKTAWLTLSGTGQLVAMTWPDPGLHLAYEA